jgi:hypothetical protein
MLATSLRLVLSGIVWLLRRRAAWALLLQRGLRLDKGRRHRKRFGLGQGELDCYSWLRLLKRQYFELNASAFLLNIFLSNSHFEEFINQFRSKGHWAYLR